MTDSSRPQDQERSRRRVGRPSPETASLLADYHEAMRTELRAVLTELAGKLEPAGLGMVEPVLTRPPIAERVRLWDLAIKLGRELGTEVDARPSGMMVMGPEKGPVAGGPKRGRVAF